MHIREFSDETKKTTALREGAACLSGGMRPQPRVVGGTQPFSDPRHFDADNCHALCRCKRLSHLCCEGARMEFLCCMIFMQVLESKGR